MAEEFSKGINLKEEKEEEPKPEYQIDLDKIPLTNDVVDMFQEGNYLIATSQNGVRFKQRIPQGKILNKLDGKWVLEDINIVREVEQVS